MTFLYLVAESHTLSKKLKPVLTYLATIDKLKLSTKGMGIFWPPEDSSSRCLLML